MENRDKQSRRARGTKQSPPQEPARQPSSAYQGTPKAGSRSGQSVTQPLYHDHPAAQETTSQETESYASKTQDAIVRDTVVKQVITEEEVIEREKVDLESADRLAYQQKVEEQQFSEQEAAWLQTTKQKFLEQQAARMETAKKQFMEQQNAWLEEEQRWFDQEVADHQRDAYRLFQEKQKVEAEAMQNQIYQEEQILKRRVIERTTNEEGEVVEKSSYEEATVDVDDETTLIEESSTTSIYDRDHESAEQLGDTYQGSTDTASLYRSQKVKVSISAFIHVPENFAISSSMDEFAISVIKADDEEGFAHLDAATAHRIHDFTFDFTRAKPIRPGIYQVYYELPIPANTKLRVTCPHTYQDGEKKNYRLHKQPGEIHEVWGKDHQIDLGTLVYHSTTQVIGGKVFQLINNERGETYLPVAGARVELLNQDRELLVPAVTTDPNGNYQYSLELEEEFTSLIVRFEDELNFERQLWAPATPEIPFRLKKGPDYSVPNVVYRPKVQTYSLLS